MALYEAGGAGGDINWSTAELPYMWDAISGHESSPYQPAVDGWRRSYELALMHRTQIENYKDKLIQAWPPERNKASQAYVDRLDQLIASLTETYEAAVANHSTFSAVLSAVASAKSNMQPLQEQYEKNKLMLAQYDAAAKDRPEGFVAPQNPLPDGRQENLRQQAATIMTSLSAELAAAQTSLVHPKPYSPLQLRDDQADSGISGGAGFAIPTPTKSISSGRATGRTRPSRSVIAHPDKQKKISTPNRNKTDQSTIPRNPSNGPVLGGTRPNSTSPNPGLPSTSTTPSGINPPNTSTPGPYGLTPSSGSSTSTHLPRNPAANGVPPGGLSPTTGSPGARGASGQHGNIIGANPGLGGPGSGRGSRSGTLGRAAQKANPIGGMIGQDGGAHPSQRRSARESEESRRRWDPNNPWETENGVDPVLLPAQEHKIDPGPSIGGNR